ncbi:unnamed protein product [Musa hybrid cultivar]
MHSLQTGSHVTNGDKLWMTASKDEQRWVADCRASHGHCCLPLEIHEAGLMALQIHEAALVELGYEGGGLPVHVRLADPPPPVLVARPDLPGDVPRLAVGLVIPALGLEAEAGRRLTSSHSSSSRSSLSLEERSLVAFIGKGEEAFGGSQWP